MVRRSHTAVLERGRLLSGPFATEPYETAWASEAIFFVRTLEATGGSPIQASVQISPDGMHWCDEGTAITLSEAPDGVVAAKLTNFGGWLRLAGETPADASATVIIYVALKE